LIVENSVFPEKASNNKNSFSLLAPNTSLQTPNNQHSGVNNEKRKFILPANIL